MSVRKLTNFDRMVDMYQPCDEPFADWLVSQNFMIVGRYLDDLSLAEVDIYRQRKMGIIPFRTSRAPGWGPNATEGAADSASTAAKAMALGVENGTTIGCDLEGCAPTTAVVDAEAYCNEWPKLVLPNWEPMLYVGDSVIMTGPQLVALPGFGLYMRSCSLVPELECGYALIQTRPGNVLVGPDGRKRLVDIDQPETDWHTPSRSATAWFP